VGLVWLVLFAAAVPAQAAFPGRNGLLVVQPASGNGLILVGADGAHPRQICSTATPCEEARDPVWSPDGSEIVFSSSQATDSNVGGPEPYVIYPDGSCLACPLPAPLSLSFYLDSWDANFGPGFLPDGRLAVSIDVNYPPAAQMGAVNTDGAGFQPFKISGSWRQPAWSPTGRLAAVRLVKGKSEVFIIDPLTGSARELTHNGAGSPTWSPDGHRLAVVHRPWIELIGSRGGRVRRLTRGRAPAWAPDGKELAFVGRHQRLFVVAARGGTPHPVGHIRAQSVDWQPATGQSPSPCQAPAGSSVLAASTDATITIDPPPAGQFPGYPDLIAPAFSVLGCLTSDGRERVLESVPPSNPDDVAGVGPVVVAGDYAALVNESSDPHYGGSGASVAVFDLRTGMAVADRGGESASGAAAARIDQLVLGPDAVTAALTSGTTCVPLSPCTEIEQIVANDSTGTHILDSVTGLGRLGGLALSGDTLTWSRDGSPRSAQLN
jgi:Tol biopolymer transport system component